MFRISGFGDEDSFNSNAKTLFTCSINYANEFVGPSDQTIALTPLEQQVTRNHLTSSSHSDGQFSGRGGDVGTVLTCDVDVLHELSEPTVISGKVANPVPSAVPKQHLKRNRSHSSNRSSSVTPGSKGRYDMPTYPKVI